MTGVKKELGGRDCVEGGGGGVGGGGEIPCAVLLYACTMNSDTQPVSLSCSSFELPAAEETVATASTTSLH